MVQKADASLPFLFSGQKMMPFVRLLLALLSVPNCAWATAVIVPDSAGYAAALERASREIRKAEADPAYPTWKLLESYSSAAGKAMLAGRPVQAVDLARRRVALAEQKGKSRERLNALRDLAEVLLVSGAAAEAVEPGRRALALAQLEYGKASIDTLLGLGTLLEVYLKAGRLDNAAPLVRQGFQVAAGFPGPAHAKSQFYDAAISYYRAIGETSEAERVLANAPQQRAAFPSTFVEDPPSRMPAPVDGGCKQVYPDEAKAYGLEGEVEVNVAVAKDGSAKQVWLSHSSGWEVLDKAAVAGFSKCRFIPAERDGRPVAENLTMAHRWTLERPVRPAPVVGSCAWGDTFVAVEAGKPAAIRIRFKVGANGRVAAPIIEYSQAPDRINEQALRQLKSCRYPTAGVGGAWLDWKD